MNYIRVEKMEERINEGRNEMQLNGKIGKTQGMIYKGRTRLNTEVKLEMMGERIKEGREEGMQLSGKKWEGRKEE